MNTEQKFGRLYHTHADRIYWRMCKMLHDPELAEDVSQEIWIKVWLHLPKDERNITSWLNTVADRTAFDAIRHRYSRSRHFTDETLEDLEYTLIDDASPLEYSEISERSQRALEHLKPKYRQILAFYLRGLTCEQMACKIGRTTFAVKVRLSRARIQFKQHFKSAS